MLNYSSLLHAYMITISKLRNVSTAFRALWARGRMETRRNPSAKAFYNIYRIYPTTMA
jgi:hypothetical protein